MPTDSPPTLPTPNELEDALPLIALPDNVMFPGTGMQLELKNAEMADWLASRPAALVAVFPAKGALTDELSAAADLHPVGVLARVVTVARQSSAVVVVLRALVRAELESLTAAHPFPMAKVRQVTETDLADDELGALFLVLRQDVYKRQVWLRVGRLLGDGHGQRVPLRPVMGS